MRQFIRHPSEIPLKYRRLDQQSFQEEKAKNVSQGGLCFYTSDTVEPGWHIEIEIPVSQPTFRATGTVVWCHQVNEQHEIGVKFGDVETEFALRLVEQVCHIEQYRKDILKTEGRTLSSEEAAREWIRTKANEFPR